MSGPDLPSLSGAATLAGRELTVRTGQLSADLHQLLDWAARRGLALTRLTASDASLGDVFRAVVQAGKLGPDPTSAPYQPGEVMSA